MDLNKKTVNFSYRIEAKPGGGFVAHTSDPTMETVEAATREELEQKMQSKIRDLFGDIGSLGGIDLKKLLGSVSIGSGLSYHIEKHEDGFRAHPNDPKLGTILEGTNKEELEQKLREMLGPEAASQFSGLLSKVGEIKVTGNVSLTANTSYGGAFSKTFHSPLIQSSQPSLLPSDSSQPNLSQDSMGPILPADQSGGVGKLLLLVLALMAIMVLIYYALHR